MSVEICTAVTLLVAVPVTVAHSVWPCGHLTVTRYTTACWVPCLLASLSYKKIAVIINACGIFGTYHSSQYHAHHHSSHLVCDNLNHKSTTTWLDVRHNSFVLGLCSNHFQEALIEYSNQEVRMVELENIGIIHAHQELSQPTGCRRGSGWSSSWGSGGRSSGWSRWCG